MTAPLGSSTVPVTEVEFPDDCPKVKKAKLKKEMIRKAARSDFT
jgi:hypothetical protein